MQQENLWATSARRTGFTLSYDLNWLDDGLDGVLKFMPKYSKHTRDEGLVVVRLDHDNHQFTPTLLTQLWDCWDGGCSASRTQRCLNNRLHDCENALVIAQ